MNGRLIIIYIICLWTLQIHAQNNRITIIRKDSTCSKSIILPYTALEKYDNFEKKLSSKQQQQRLATALSLKTAIAAGSLCGLYYAWYMDYNMGKFHLFNDFKEWEGMDKCGHSFSSYYLSSILYKTSRWSGQNHGNSILYATLLPWTYLLGIEIFDGFSQGWGFSIPDITANTIGSLLFLTQQMVWNEQRFTLKYSYLPYQNYAQYRPELLGRNFAEKILKDYNNMTFWLSCNLNSFIKSPKFPNWLNICIGYGSNGMLGAKTNPQGDNYPDCLRYNQFYLSLDVDFTKIKTQSKFLKSLFSILNGIKVPFLTLEINNNKQGANIKCIIH